jgi:hypothetical protein
MRSPTPYTLPPTRNAAPLKQRINSFVAKTSAAANATMETAKASSSCAQMTTKPIRMTKTIEFLVVTTQRRLSSIDKAWLREIPRTTNVRIRIIDTSRINDLSPSKTTELSTVIQPNCIPVILSLFFCTG